MLRCRQTLVAPCFGSSICRSQISRKSNLILHIEERGSSRSLKLQNWKVVLRRDKKGPVTTIVHQIIIFSVVLCLAIFARRALLHWPPSERIRSTAGLLQTVRSDVLLAMSHRYVLLLSRRASDNRIYGDPGSLTHPSNCKDVVAKHKRKYE